MGWSNCAFQSYQKWFVGNDIRNLLLGDEAIQTQVGNKVFPCIAPENTDGDFIIYLRQRYSKDTVKNGVYIDECSVAVIAISDNYDNAISLASKIDNCLTGQHTLLNGARLELMLSDSTEEFSDNKYIETLIFRIK